MQTWLLFLSPLNTFGLLESQYTFYVKLDGLGTAESFITAILADKADDHVVDSVIVIIIDCEDRLQEAINTVMPTSLLNSCDFTHW